MKTLFDHLIVHAKVRPDHAALVEGAQTLSYGQLYRRALAVAKNAQSLGITHGQKVLLMVPLGIDFFVLFMGLMKMGVSVILIDPAQPKSVIAQCVDSVKPDVFMGVKKAHLLRLIPSLRAIPKAIATDGFSWIADSIDPSQEETEDCELASVCAGDAALMTFTSGSTGRPKTIVRSHDFLIKQHEAVQKTLNTRPDDVELSTLPVFILSNLGAGITSVIPLKNYAKPHKMDAAAMVAYARDKGVNRILASPAFLARICDTGLSLDGVTRLFTGGGPIFPNMLERLRRFSPNAEIMMVYGSSEAEPIAHCLADEITQADAAKIGGGGGLLAGHWDPSIKLKIITPEAQIHGRLDRLAFANVEVANNEVGEIVVSGDHVIKGYLNPLDNAQTKFCVENEIWHRTGDAGYIDDKNRLWLMGRVSARLTTPKSVLYPFALEAAIMCHANVARAAAVKSQGEVVMVIETVKPLDLLSLNRLKAAHPAIDRIVMMKSIPVDKRHHSKVLYAELAKKLGI